VCDHFVVRETLMGHQMGQVEDIKNYLKCELKNHSLRYLSVNEEESTTETETGNNRTTETATQQRHALSAASQNTADAAVGLDARVKTEHAFDAVLLVDVALHFGRGGLRERWRCQQACH
jgi:hypothetical protein